MVFFDRPRCILCYRCVRMCGEGMDVWALGVQNRGVTSIIAPNKGDHLDCEECGMCIDACPVGALTSGAYRYKTRPWEMNHVSTVCTHCADGCKTTLGVRSVDNGSEILRGDNRDKSGINGDFLCIKGRYAFDFANHTDRLTKPLLRQPDGKFAEVSWEQALQHAGTKLREIRESQGGKHNRSHRLQPHHQRRKLPAAKVRPHGAGNQQHRSSPHRRLHRLCPRDLRPEGPRRFAARDHDRTGDSAAGQRSDRAASPAGLEPAHQRAPQQCPHLRREPCRHQAGAAGARIADHSSGWLCRRGALPGRRGCGLPWQLNLGDEAKKFREALRAEPSLLIIFGSEYRGRDIEALVNFGLGLPHARFACLGDYVNSRGAADMGLLPGLLPGYVPVTQAGAFAEEYGDALPPTPGMDLVEMFDAAGRGELAALYVVGSNPVARYGIDPAALKNTFLVVQDMFLTETALLADVVLAHLEPLREGRNRHQHLRRPATGEEGG